MDIFNCHLYHGLVAALGRKPTLPEWKKAQDDLADMPLKEFFKVPKTYAKSVREPEAISQMNEYEEGFVAFEIPCE